MEIYGLLETSSRMAPTKPELQAVLQTWLTMGRRNEEDPEYLDKLSQAVELLNNSKSVPEFLQQAKNLDDQ